MGRLIIIFLLSAFTSKGQDSILQLQPIKTITGLYQRFYVDNFGDIYLISNNSQIKKYTVKGDSVGVFNDNMRFGKLHSMDVSNPLKILLFYKEYNILIILDRFLGIRNMIDLKKQNLNQIAAACISYDGNIWLYDELNARIKKIDENGTVQLQSNDLRLSTVTAISPSFMYDANNKLYVYDSAIGCLLFDYYGSYQTNLNFKHLSNISLTNNELIGMDSLLNVHLYDIENYQSKKIKIQSLYIGNQIQKTADVYYILKTDGLHIYKSSN